MSLPSKTNSLSLLFWDRTEGKGVYRQMLGE
jgi:hypothetical protein